MTEINKYNNSKIYKICSNLSEKIYIGSTTQSLAQRLSEHVKHYKQYVNKTRTNFTTSFDIIKLDDYFITLIEEHSYNNRSQLFRREGELIKLNINICVNKQLTGRTDYEYRQDNKEHIAENKKEYYESNKQSISEKQKQYNIYNKDYLTEKQKHRYQLNKEELFKTIICDCGSNTSIQHKSRHIKSKKHISFITNQYYINELNI